MHLSPAGMESSQLSAGCEAVLANLIALITTFTGDQLTWRVLRDVWPTIPLPAASPQSINGHVEANG